MRTRQPSATTAIALLALFFALGGTAVAARHYLITSTSQIKPSVLRQLMGAPGLAQGTPGAAGPTGPQGPAGPTGPQGPQGPAGPSNVSGLTEVQGPKNSVAAGGVATSVATCPTGQHAVSGGSNVYAGTMSGEASEADEGRTSWFVVVANSSSYGGGYVEAIAYCAGSGQAVAARSNTAAHARAVREASWIAAQLAQQLKASNG